MAAALPVVRSLFALATRGETGVFRIERVEASRGAVTSRLELEQGYVHAMANVGAPGSLGPRGEETLTALLGALPDEARPGFEARPPRSPLAGRPVPAFHPARAIRRHLEVHARDRAGVPPSDEARLTLVIRPHASCIDGLEALLVALLDTPRHFGDLAAAAPRPLAERLIAFLEAAGAVGIDDPATDSAWAALGLPAGAPPEAIKRAYRQLARELHPDLHAGQPDVDHLTERFRAVSAAYRHLLPSG